MSWFLCGGFPGYLRQFDSSLPVRVNIERTFLRDDHPFAHEADFLLRDEQVAEIPVYLEILRSIAIGRHRLSEIEEHAGTQRARAVQHLVATGMVEKRLPLGGSAARPRYFLTSPLISFALRFLPPLRSFLRLLPPAELYARIEPQLDSYWGARWEQCVLAHLPDLLASEGTPAVRGVGSYWNDRLHIQIDALVWENKQRWHFCECKWTGSQPSDALLQLKTAAGRHPAMEKGGITPLWRLLLASRPKGKGSRASAEAKILTAADLLALPSLALQTTHEEILGGSEKSPASQTIRKKREPSGSRRS
jgi:hypothetical protein